MALCLLLCAATYADETRRVHDDAVFGYLELGKETMQAIERLKKLGLQPKHGSKILFMRDPFEETYDITFISALSWNDRSLRIWQQDHSHFPPAEIAGMDYLIDYDGGQFVVLKPSP
jgi:hypothetical protein